MNGSASAVPLSNAPPLGWSRPSSSASLFLAGQWIAWEQLVQQGFYFNSPDPSSHFFYLITGVHGLHLLLGVFALAAALGAMFILRRIELRQIVVDCTAWYWHTMGIFWIFLFGLLAFFQ